MVVNNREPQQSKASQTHSGLFVVNGEYWTIGLVGLTFSIKDIKGLHYIQRLLQHPNNEFHSLDLIGNVSGEANIASLKVGYRDALPVGITIRQGLTGDAGEMLDAQAKHDYQRRLYELKESIEEHRKRGNLEQADRIESEIDFLAREIKRAVGRGGRLRRTGSHAERARLNVTRAIRTAIDKISEHQVALGELLNRSIRTGSFCSYIPDHQNFVTWQFSADSGPVVHEIPRMKLIVSRRDTSFLRAYTSGTTLVGRDGERSKLLYALDNAQRGDGKFLLIEGAPGVGKTRLAAEIADEALRRGMLTFIGSCYDRDEPVPFIPFVEILEAALAQTRDPAAFRDMLGTDAPEIARLVPQLRRLFPDIPTPFDLSPEQSRRILFDAVTELVKRVSHNSPTLFLLDDLHWADDGTLLLLNHIAPFIPTLPIIVVGTLRDFELDPSGQRNRTIDELIRRHLIERLTLGGLRKESVAEMLRALSGQEPPEAVARLFYSDTDGNPFFVEELYKHLAEQDRLFDATGAIRQDLKFNVDMPQSLRVVIRRRLALVTEDTLKMLYTAAVIGRSFTFELLAAAMNIDQDSLLNCVEEAENFGLISSGVQYPEARFRFSHELFRQAVLSQVSVARRQRTHLQIGGAIENLNAGALDEVAIELAYHFQSAGTTTDNAKTVRYLAMAAKQARLQGALTETRDFYRDALLLLKRMPDKPERDRLELGLQLGIGAVLMATRGYSDIDTANAYERATTLGERLGDPTQVVFALTGLSSISLLRGELESAQGLADQALVVSQRHGKSKTQTWGYHIVGVLKYHSGHLESAWAHLKQAQALYREEEHRKNPQDPGIEMLEYMALTAWQLGLADTARARMHDALSLSNRIQKPFGLARSNFYAAYLQVLLRDPEAARRCSEKGIEYSTKYSIPLYLEASRIVYGWAIAQQGRCVEGLACIRSAVENYKAAGNRIAIGSFLGFLAEALLSAGLPKEAMIAVESGFSLAPQEPTGISYLWWLKGTLLLEDYGSATTAQISKSTKPRTEDAEKSFRKAMSVAESVGARSYERRAAIDLGKLLIAGGRAPEAYSMVKRIISTFTEGLDTRELIDAKQLIEGLR